MNRCGTGLARVIRCTAAAPVPHAEAKGLQLRMVPCGATVRTDPRLLCQWRLHSPQIGRSNIPQFGAAARS